MKKTVLLATVALCSLLFIGCGSDKSPLPPASSAGSGVSSSVMADSSRETADRSADIPAASTDHSTPEQVPAEPSGTKSEPEPAPAPEAPESPSASQQAPVPEEPAASTEPKPAPEQPTAPAKPKPAPEPNSQDETARDYVLNTNTKKFHFPNCASAKRIKAKNRADAHDTRSNIIKQGYDPCGKCHP